MAMLLATVLKSSETESAPKKASRKRKSALSEQPPVASSEASESEVVLQRKAFNFWTTFSGLTVYQMMQKAFIPILPLLKRF